MHRKKTAVANEHNRQRTPKYKKYFAEAQYYVPFI